MYHLAQVLSAEEVAAVRDALVDATFEDGKATAGAGVQSAKQNEQVAREKADLGALDQLVVSALSRNAVFQSVVQPKRILTPTYSRYRPGMRYGMHVDNALMGGQQPLRTDL